MTESDQGQAYKEWLSGVFGRSSAAYGLVGPNFFTHFGTKLVEYAGLYPGAKVLDLACGTGACLFPAAKKVGPSGLVIGIDLASDMVAATRQKLDRRNISGVQDTEMDAECLLFPSATFDFVFCGLALFFFPNIEQALAEIYRVLKPSGLLLASTFGEYDPRWEPFHQLAASYKDQLKETPQVKTTQFSSPTEIIETLSKAGFTNIEVFVEKKEFYFQDEEEWWSFLWSQGSRAFLERFEIETLNRFQAEATQLVQGFAGEQGIPLSEQVLITRARCHPLA